MSFPLTSLEAALERANIYDRVGEISKAEGIYYRILERDPHHAIATNNLGSLLQRQGRLVEAIEMFRKLVALEPNMAMAHQNLGATLCENGNLEESFLSYRTQAKLTYPSHQESLITDRTSHILRHSREQYEYLKTAGDDSIDGFYIDAGNRVAGRALASSSKNYAGEWQRASPKIIVIDDLLTNAAIQALRFFCLNSSIWRQSYSAGYLGAMPEHGMGSPLLAQISEELRANYPLIFQNYPLLHYWGFKYDRNSIGTRIHADFASINVNFWITPDEANLAPDTGGLIVWDTGAPIDWDFAKYNADSNSARTFLSQTKAKPVAIPYKYNRAVIFDSGLFHETDRFDFKDGYANQRINITMLYGRREELI